MTELPWPPGQAPRLLLVGAGHANLFVLEGIAAGRLGPVRARLLVPARRHLYSGMLTGLVGGRYRVEELTFDLAAIAAGCGVELVIGSAVAVDPAKRTVALADGRRVEYDLLSLAVGSGVAGADLPGVGAQAAFVKPIDQALRIDADLSHLARGDGRRGARVVVVGGGTAGVELSLNACARLAELGVSGREVTVVDRHDGLLGDRSPAAARQACRAAAEAGIRLALGDRVTGAEPGRLQLESGRWLPFDLLVWAAGSAAPMLPRASSLPTDRHGYLLVDDTLRSTGDPRVFAAGDVATLRSYPDTPKAGVFAVRQGPVLRDNLAAALGALRNGRAPDALPRRYRPQHGYLALLNIGDGRALLSYGRLALTATWAMRLKDWIDRRFMRRFSRLGAPSP